MTVKEYLLELKKYSQYDFSEYSDNSIQRRLLKILEEHELDMNKLLEMTKNNPAFVENLVNEITVNTTEFYRDTDVWIEYALSFLDKIKIKKVINIWHAGSSSGQEVYSNLILLDAYGYLNKSNIIATDINQVVIDEAKKGEYRLSTNLRNIEQFQKDIDKSINGDHLLKTIDFKKYFSESVTNDRLEIKQFLKKVPLFIKHDLVKEKLPYEVKFDIIFCRNVLIYFNTSLQSRILKMFHDRLNNGGMLVLGSHEGVSGFVKTRFVKRGNFFAKNNIFHLKY
ncbi:MAG: protein-glutamate O-methyltransferase CheR [Marinilabiliaceae bacterium]|nr:protein-glutamate O-methyltransferase CheR [Marinilabiliaceae bacterium]